jgi:hypothetical protein
MENKMNKSSEGFKPLTDTSQDLQDALEVAKQFIKTYDKDDKNVKHWDFFRALVELSDKTIQSEPEQCEGGEISFLKLDIGQRMQLPDPASYTRYHTLFKNLDLSLQDLRPTLERIANNMGKKVYPIIAQHKGGGSGNSTEYYIKPISVNERTVSNVKSTLNISKTVDYELESELTSLPLWSRWIYPVIERKKLVLALGISPFITLIMFAILFFIENMGWYDGAGFWGVLALGYTFFYWMHLRYFTQVIRYNICLLPDWLLPLRLSSAVMEIELNEPKTNLLLKKAIKVRVYRATCPVCGYRINLKQRQFYSDEIIGECVAHPRLHRFTFDFTNRTGERLT